MHSANIMPFERPLNSVQKENVRKENAVDDCFRWMQAALNQARDEAGEALQRLRLRQRVCRAELRELYTELESSARRGLETVTLEVQIQRRIEETTLCQHQAQQMEQHLEALSQRLDRARQYACVN